MEFNLYKVNSRIEKFDLDKYFGGYNYVISNSIYKKETKIYAYYEKNPREATNWFNFINNYFEVEMDFGEKLNFVLLLELAGKELYLIPFGKAYTKMARVIDFDFGMSFAEKQLKSSNIKGKKIDYYLQNKIREISRIRSDWLESAIPNQSYSEVSGTPNNENIFGGTIYCSDKVTFKAQGITNEEILNDIIFKTNEANKTLILKDVSSDIPRIRVFRNKDEGIIEQLFDNLNASIINDEDSHHIIFTGVFEDERHTKFIDFHNLYFYKEKIKLDNVMEINHLEDVINYVKQGNDIRSLRTQYITEDGERYNEKFLSYLDITINYNDTNYIYTKNRWHFLNNTFINLLEKQLEDITIELHNRNLQCNEIKDEDDYIKQTIDNTNILKLHKKNVKGLSVPIEIADLYNESENELFAVKTDVKTGKSVYSLQQAMLAMTVLRSTDDFDYSALLPTVKNINTLKAAQSYSIVWVLLEHEDPNKGTAQSYLNKYNNNTLELKDFQSILMKLKISEWYQLARQLNFIPKIYLTKSKVKPRED